MRGCGRRVKVGWADQTNSAIDETTSRWTLASMLTPDRIRNKALRRYVESGDASKLDARWLKKITRICSLLNVIISPQELDLPGLSFHKLKGDRADTFAFAISGNWRITFKWDDEGPFDVELEDYHG